MLNLGCEIGKTIIHVPVFNCYHVVHYGLEGICVQNGGFDCCWLNLLTTQVLISPGYVSHGGSQVEDGYSELTLLFWFVALRWF